MKIPDYIEVKNAAGQRVACLSPRADGLKECYIDKRLNGESKLEFLLPANSEKIEELTPECTIWAGGKVFTLLKDDAIDFVRDENNRLWAKYMAKERWAELDTKFPEPYITNDPTIPEPADLAVIIVGGGSDLSGGRYDVGTAGHALYAVLDGSGWTLGACDVTGIHDLEVEKVSRLELIKMVQDMWGGYLVWDSINKTVSLRDANKWQNYTGFQIRYAKNLKHITRTQSNRLVTKLYCFGHDDLDIASVNGGKKYITNNSYTPREYVGIYKNQDIYDPNELLEKATAELELICRPRYNYTVKIADLRTLPEYEHEDFSLGDMVDIIDPNVAPDKPRARLLRHKYNLFQPWKCELESGDPIERFAEQLKASFDTSNFIENVFDSMGKISGYKLIDFSVTHKHLADAAVTTRAIADLSVDVDKLADLAVEAAKLADSSVTATKIANAAVGSAAIAQAAIGSAHIANGVILNAHIGDAQITNAKIGELSANKITSGLLRGIQVQQMSTDGTVLADFFTDDNGGKLTLYDNGGDWNVRLGCEGVGGDNVGGTLVLYNNSEDKQRVELGISRARDSGVIHLRNSSGNIRVSFQAEGNTGSPYIGIADNSQKLVTYLTESSGYIASEQIATRTWANNRFALDSHDHDSDYAYKSHSHSNYATNSELVTVMIDHIEQYHS